MVLYGIRVVAEQHYEPSRLMRAKHRLPSTNKSGEDCDQEFPAHYRPLAGDENWRCFDFNERMLASCFVNVKIKSFRNQIKWLEFTETLF